MSLATLKALVRQLAQVDSTMVSQVDTNSDTLDSGETIALLDALSEHSKHYPQIKTVLASAPSGYDVALSTLVADWGPEHRIDLVRYPLTGQDWQELEKQDVLLYQDPAGAWYVRFLRYRPSAEWWLTYTAPHVLTSAVDTLSAQRPGETQAIAHLGAANVLMMASNKQTKQYDANLSADSSDTAAQGTNYDARAEKQRTEYYRRVRHTETGNGTVDWGYPSDGNPDRFWRSRRHQ